MKENGKEQKKMGDMRESTRGYRERLFTESTSSRVCSNEVQKNPQI